MTIELDHKSHIIALWFSSNDEGYDWLACVIRHPNKSGYYKGCFRFRYPNEDKAVNNEDTKKWTFFETKANENALIETIHEIQKKLANQYPHQDFVHIDGGLKRFEELTKNKEWIHITGVEEIE